eukprot:TRINITY_DN29077_c0_g1_i1.p1 TRINITY_DN29077_c0_g1~~TRINITY_DN29077_c0_g1_i1.p1  ORF type:complete len:307 (+),score=52.78 TRINITY_DN29077_c0_g1_i1:171-1091(+)
MLDEYFLWMDAPFHRLVSQLNLPSWVFGPVGIFILVFVMRSAIAYLKATQRLKRVREQELAKRRKLFGQLPKLMPMDYETVFNDVREKWQRRIEDLPVAIDFPRLHNKVDLCMDGKAVEQAADPDRSLLATLDSIAALLDADARPLIRERYAEIFSPDSHDHAQAMKMLLPHLENHRTSRLLKAINQAIIAPPVIKLKTEFGRKHPFKDLRGAWRIRVDVRPPEAGDDEAVSVVHTRSELSFEADLFQFDWDFKMLFNRDLTCLSEIAIGIKHVRFGATATAAFRTALERDAELFNKGANAPGQPS